MSGVVWQVARGGPVSMCIGIRWQRSQVGTQCHMRHVVSGALCHRPKALRLSLTLDILHLVLILKLRLKPPRIARGAEETIPVKTFYNLFGYKPGRGVPRARE